VCARGAFSPLSPSDRGDARDVLYVCGLVVCSNYDSRLASAVVVLRAVLQTGAAVSPRFVFVGGECPKRFSFFSRCPVFRGPRRTRSCCVGRPGRASVVCACTRARPANDFAVRRSLIHVRVFLAVSWESVAQSSALCTICAVQPTRIYDCSVQHFVVYVAWLASPSSPTLSISPRDMCDVCAYACRPCRVYGNATDSFIGSRLCYCSATACGHHDRCVVEILLIRFNLIFSNVH